MEQDLDRVIQNPDYSPKVLRKIGQGTTTNAYIYQNRVYKHQFLTSTHTEFDTAVKVKQEMTHLKFVLPEQSIRPNVNAVDFCPCIFDAHRYTNDSIYNIRLQIIAIQFADALAVHNIYALDLHLGNIGQHYATGKYHIIDTEGFIKSKKGRSRSKQCVVVNAKIIPHVAKHKTWLSIFDAAEGWYANEELGKVVTEYVKYMKSVKRYTDIQLRTFVSHYLLGDTNPSRRHVVGGLKFLQFTSVYNNASIDTRKTIDTFLKRYMGTGYIIRPETNGFKTLSFTTPWLNCPNYEERITQLATLLNKVYPTKTLESVVSISPFWKTFIVLTGVFGAGYYGTRKMAQQVLTAYKSMKKPS